MTNKLALLAHWSVRIKLNHVSSVQFSYFALYALKCARIINSTYEANVHWTGLTVT